MYTAVEIERKQSSIADRVDIVVKYQKDGVDYKTIIHDKIFDVSRIPFIISEQIKDFPRQEANAAYLAGQPGVIDLSVTLPSDADKAKADFDLKRFELIKAKQDFDLGLIDQATFDATLAVATDAKPVTVTATPLTP